MDFGLFVRDDVHISAEDRKLAKQNPTLSSAVRVSKDPSAFKSPEEILEASRQKYLESLDPATTCYDKYRRLLKPGMTVEYMGKQLVIKDIVTTGTAQVPRLVTKLKDTIVPCATVLVRW